mgnify:FL=1
MATGVWGPFEGEMAVGEMVAAVVGDVYAGDAEMQRLAASAAAACKAAFVVDCDDFMSMTDISMARAFRQGAGDLGPGLQNLICKHLTPKGQPPHKPPPALLPEEEEALVVQTQQPLRWGREGKGGSESSPNFKEALRKKSDISWDGKLPSKVEEAVVSLVSRARG